MLAEGTRACRTGPEASSPGVPRRPPAPAFSVKKLSAAHRRQPPSRAKPVIAPHSVPQAGRTPPAARLPCPIPLRPPPTRQPTEYSRRPRAARGRRGGGRAARDAPRGRSGRPRGGDRGGRARSRSHASACRPGHAGPLCACSGEDTAVTCLASAQPPCKLSLGVSPPRDASLGARAQ